MKAEVEVAGKTIAVEIASVGSNPAVRLDGREVVVDLAWIGPRELSLLIDGRSYEVELQPQSPGSGGGAVVVSVRGLKVVADAEPLRAAATPRASEAKGEAVVRAPMPGKVVAVLVEPGDLVIAGQGVVVVEAMKMENELQSPIAGIVRAVAVRIGQVVEGGAVTVEIGPGGEAS